MQRCPDISRARALLGWAPRIELEQGLMHTIAYFERLLAESGHRVRLGPGAVTPADLVLAG
jgi:UDP-glucuronate decarboxylase